MKDECCNNCRYFALLEHNFKRGNGFEKSNCCLMFPFVFKEMAVVEVLPDDRCEMFVRRTRNEL